MDNNIYDDLYEHESNTSIVVENTKGLRNFLSCFKIRRKYGKKFKGKLHEYFQEFAEA